MCAVDLTTLSRQIDDSEDHFDVENILRIDQNMFRMLALERSIKEMQEFDQARLDHSLNNYLAYLSRGTVKNKFMHQITMHFSNLIKGDLITKFNKKSVKLIDSLINDVLARVKFKDLCSVGASSKSPPVVPSDARRQRRGHQFDDRLAVKLFFDRC